MKRLLNLPVDEVLEDIVPKKVKTPKKTIYERKVDFDVWNDTYERELGEGNISLSDFWITFI